MVIDTKLGLGSKGLVADSVPNDDLPYYQAVEFKLMANTKVVNMSVIIAYIKASIIKNYH